MRRPGPAVIVMVLLAATAVAAADRIRAAVTCVPAPEPLTYDCTLVLENARTGAPLEGARITVGADMPSMPMAHHVRPVEATPTGEPGAYRARLAVEMHGRWALRLDVTGPVRDRVVTVVDLTEGHEHRH